MIMDDNQLAAELVRQSQLARYGFDATFGAESTLNALRESAPLRAAEETEELRKAFEESERKRDEDRREQAKENRVNRWLTVASLLMAFVSMVVAILALIK